METSVDERKRPVRVCESIRRSSVGGRPSFVGKELAYSHAEAATATHEPETQYPAVLELLGKKPSPRRSSKMVNMAYQQPSHSSLPRGAVKSIDWSIRLETMSPRFELLCGISPVRRMLALP